jgi:hypothetical protein
MTGRAPAQALLRTVLGLAAIAGIPVAGVAAPRTCDLAVSVSPAMIPAGARTARIRIPGALSDIRLRTSSGAVSAPMDLGVGALVAEFTAASNAPPVAVVAAVGGSACGFTVVRVAGELAVQPAAQPVTLVMLDPPAAPADRDADVLVYVFAVDSRGAPRLGSAPVLHPGTGTVGKVEALAPGAWRGRWRIPAGEASAVSMKAAFGTEEAVSGSLARPPGSAASMEIVPDEPTGPGVPGAPVAVLVRIRDSQGNLTDGPLEVDSDVARAGTPVQVERGIFRVPLVVAPGTRNDAVVIAARSNGVTATATLPVAPSAAATVRVSPPGPIQLGGSSRAEFVVLEVVVVDALGNPVNDVPVGSGGAGEFREALPVSPGRWGLPYRPPSISENTSEQVVVKAGAASTTLDLELVARRLAVSLGLKAGVSVAGGSVGMGVGAEVGAWTHVGRAQLGLVLDVDWWMVSGTSDVTVGGASSSYKATQNYIPILLSLGWRTRFADRWMLWATLGGGGSVVSNSAQVSGQPTVSESGFAPAVSASVSAGRRLGPGFPFLEVRATWIGDANLSTLSGSSTSFLGLLGYRFDVG